jgi:hypothetical protein
MRVPLFLLLAMLVAVLHAQDPVRPVKLFEPFGGGPAAAAVDTPTTDSIIPRWGVGGQVTVIADPRIEHFMEEYVNSKHPLKGYRVQVFLGTDRNEANRIRTAFLQKYPDIPAYLGYLAPNFRVRVGDLRDKVGAEKLRQALKADYPGCYVVQDEIEMPRLPGER